MNERIKELREQAADFASVTYDNYTMATFDTNKSIETLFEDKFTELIVMECARIADRKYLYSKEPNRWDSGFNISCEILEQFGILKDE